MKTLCTWNEYNMFTAGECFININSNMLIFPDNFKTGESVNNQGSWALK